MGKKLYTYLGIGLLVILLIWEADKNSSVRLVWRNVDEIMPLVGLLFWFLIFTGFICVLNSVLHRVVRKQLHDALSFSDNSDDESLPVSSLQTSPEKLVLKRSDIDKAMMLLLKSMASITAGDMRAARNNLKELKEIIGNDTIIDVLMLKIYKGEKDFDKMEELSSKLMNNPNLQLISLKASVEAQMQKKEFEQALANANKAFEVRQDLYWVIESAFSLRAKAGDWEGALQVLNSGFKKKIIPHQKYNELKSVTLYQIAQEAKQKGDMLNFFKFCTQALDTCKTLVPAALALAQYYVENDNQTRKAAKILSRIWRCNPTEDVAKAYLQLWSDDTPIERVQRMESFALANSLRPSLNNLLLAELDVEAGLWGKAKSEFEIFLINNPATKKLAKLIYHYEKHAVKNEQAAENWKKKTENCAEDGMWVCQSCGHTSAEWKASCKKCGSVGRFDWRLYINKK